MLTYADVCRRMLTYADVLELSDERLLLQQVVTYADVC